MRRLLTIAAAILLLAAGCGEEQSDETTTPMATEDEVTSAPAESEPAEEPAGPYTLTLDVESGGGDLLASGTTNLPDDTVINIVTSRIHRYEGEKDYRASSAGSGKTTVAGGTFETSLEVDESELAKFADPEFFGVMTELDSDITVCSEVRTGEDFDGKPEQPDADVREQLGASGEELRDSPDAYEFGSATDNPSFWLEKQTSVKFPSEALGTIVKAQGNEPVVAPLNDNKRFCA